MSNVDVAVSAVARVLPGRHARRAAPRQSRTPSTNPSGWSVPAKPEADTG